MYPDLRSILDSPDEVTQSFRVAPQGQFCDNCRKIDFASLFFTRDPKYNSAMWISRNKPPRYYFGSVAEVQLKSSECRLCSWIMQRLQDRPRRYRLSPAERVEMWTSPYFTAQFTEDERGLTLKPLYFRKLDLNVRGPKDMSNSLSETDMVSFQFCESKLPTVADTSPAHKCVVSNLPAKPCPCLSGAPLSSSTSRLERLRVIDVKFQRIVDVPAECRYIALSYVWGSSNTLQLTRETYNSMHEFGFFESQKVPATVRDAMLVVQGCGERFLWVDALCIIQDDVTDRTFQLGPMGFIYQRAFFTIFATCGDHAESGLPGVRPETRNVEQHHIALGDFGIMSLMNDFGPEVNMSAWQRRAWTLQEGVFSQKGLFFTANQIHWRCRRAHWCEETNRETGTLFDLGQTEDRWGRYSNLQTALSPTLSLDTDLFYRMLQVYTFRRLTFGGDMLNAMTGILRAITDLTGFYFVWGLPERQFTLALAWSLGNRGPMMIQSHDYRRNYSFHQARLNDGSSIQVPFPTWSWTGWRMGYYVSWNRESDPHNTPLNSEAFYPEITFYHYSNDGKLTRIRDWPIKGGRLEFEDRLAIADRYSELRSRWMGVPNTIDQLEDARQFTAEATIDNPFYLNQLIFWTSCARVIIKASLNTPSPDFTQDGDVIKYDDAGDQILLKGVHYEPAAIKTEPLVTADVVRDFIIIGRSIVQTDWLDGLIVRWQDGKAYRVGHGNVSEENWIASKRFWKLVTLS